eukprot:4496561-Pyramimonas_sp.AAC.1
MCTALGELPPDWAVRIDAAPTVASPRDRLWFNNSPPADDLVTYPRLPSPWERGWTYRPDGHIPPWTQSKAPANALEAI